MFTHSQHKQMVEVWEWPLFPHWKKLLISLAACWLVVPWEPGCIGWGLWGLEVVAMGGIGGSVWRVVEIQWEGVIIRVINEVKVFLCVWCTCGVASMYSLHSLWNIGLTLRGSNLGNIQCLCWGTSPPPALFEYGCVLLWAMTRALKWVKMRIWTESGKVDIECQLR